MLDLSHRGGHRQDVRQSLLHPCRPFALAPFLRPGMVEDVLHAATHLAASLRPGFPDRPQDCDHVIRVDGPDYLCANLLITQVSQ